MGEPASRLGLDTIQLQHRRWIEHNFPGQTEFQAFMGMVEEMGELSHHLLKREQNIRGRNVNHEREIRDACADLVIFMMGLADVEGFSLLNAINEAWDQVKERDWIKYPGDGRTV
jgi:NTP pyrophosphatase (non-canonical NTP hydrolase)